MKNKYVGFTLIELLVVISIIGILSSLALVSYSGSQKQARDTQRKSDLNQYRNVLEAYAGGHGGLYPVESSSPFDVSGFCSSGELSNYISSCPKDPLPNQKYYYLFDSSGTAYALYATMESGGYWAVCSNGKTKLYTGSDTPNIDCSESEQ